MERIIMGVAVAALATGLAASEFARFEQGRSARVEAQRLADDVNIARSQADAALAAVIPGDVVNTANASVYLVLIGGDPAGTAFVVDRERGLLATAAHVIEGSPFDDAERPIEILNQQTGQRLRVAAGRAHAGFGAFRTAVEAHQPMRGDRPLSRPVALGVEETPFDAAILVVDPLNAETGAFTIGPALTVASDETLFAMKAGDPIAVVGFPVDRVGLGMMPFSADSRAERGVVSAMVAPVDSADMPRDPRVANLIIHRMATAGGNSGSPVLNAAGEVVGIHTHGHSGGESNGDGLAQRADILRDLLEPLREETRLAALFRPAWTERLKAWPRAADGLPWSLFMVETAPEKAEKTLFGEIDYAAAPPFQHMQATAQFSEETERFIAFAPDIKATAPAGTKRGATLTAGVQPAFEIDETAQYYEHWFVVDRSRHTTIYAFDYAVNRSAGYCRVDAYWRQSGDTELKLLRGRGAFRLNLTPEPAAPSGVHVVFRRASDCDRASRDFIFGAVSWDDPSAAGASAHDAPAPQTVVAALAGDAVNAVARGATAMHVLVACRRPGAEPGARPAFCDEAAPAATIPVSMVHAGPASVPVSANDLDG